MEAGILWREEVQAIKDKEFKKVELNHMLADNCAMQLLRYPKQFDVILADNLFGDMLSDEAAMLTGSLGLLPSASLGAKDKNGRVRSLYEPVHGSAPDIEGKNIANPIATILSLSMALRYSLDLGKEADQLDKAVQSVDNLFLVASSKSAGKKIKFKNKEIEIEDLENYNFSRAQITFFAAGSKVAKEWVPKAAKETIVIDNSSYFRMQKDVPLVVPEVNSEALNKHKNIIANPNCSTMQMVLPLKPLHDEYKIKRVIVSTYQAVSGAGKDPMDELFDQSRDYLDGKKINPINFTKQIAFNLIPHIDSFDQDGYTKEELKMTNETS